MPENDANNLATYHYVLQSEEFHHESEDENKRRVTIVRAAGEIDAESLVQAAQALAIQYRDSGYELVTIHKLDDGYFFKDDNTDDRVSWDED